MEYIVISYIRIYKNVIYSSRENFNYIEILIIFVSSLGMFISY